MTEINDPLLDLLNQKPKREASLATYHGAYLWRHHRFELPEAGTDEHTRLAPLVTLLESKIRDRRDQVARIMRAIDKTRLVCEEMIASLNANDELRETHHPVFDMTGFRRELQRADHDITLLVQALDGILMQQQR